MKQINLIASAFAVALALGTGAASADIVVNSSGQPLVVDQGGPSQSTLVGSDTLNRVMDCLVNGCSGVTALGLTQINNYLGQGSSQGERQMAGSPNAGTTEPACTVGGVSDPNGLPELNPGCQEIAPMSREMNNSVCDDDITTPGGASGNNSSAESLAICGDGILVVTDNRSHSQTADTAADCVATPAAAPPADTSSTNARPFQPAPAYAKSGKLRRGGTITTTTGSYSISDWKDVLRLIYTGCTNDGFGVKNANGTADLTCGSVNRYLRCTNPVRQAVVDDWFNIVEDGAKGGSDTAVKCDGTGGTPNNTQCAAGVNGGLRHAFRRDDSSGTTTFFLATLGLNQAVGHRIAWISGVQNKPVDIPAHAADAARAGLDSGGNMYCDGGDIEGYELDAVQCTANATNACPDYSSPSSDPANPYPKTLTCPSYGECAPPPQVGPTATSCTPGAVNACRNYLRDKVGFATLTCPASGVCANVPEMGDPLTKPCRTEDTLCAWNGRAGIVQALISPAVVGGVDPFPAFQAKRGSLATPPVPPINSAFDVCLDGNPPPCSIAFFPNTDGTKNWNAINDSLSHVSTLVDGRAYNPIIRDSAGNVQCLTGSPAGHNCTLLGVAQWRSDMAALKLTLPVNGGAINPDTTATALPHARCQQADATQLIGCVVANTQCTVGFAGREIGESPDAVAGGQEPFRINATTATDDNILNFLADTGLPNARIQNYVFARYLYLAAIGGFNNVTSDCLARGGTAAYCADEVKIVNTFIGSNYDAVGAPTCQSAGFIALPTSQNDVNGVAQPLRECRGSAGPTSAATCGATGTPRQDTSLAPANNCVPM